MDKLISGIQQIGVGVADSGEAARHFRDVFGIKALVFDDIAEAKLMTAYTSEKVERRRAILSLNMKGGGGFEIWQYKSRKPAAAQFEILPGDLGYYAARLKAENIEAAYAFFKSDFPNLITSSILKANEATANFWVKDQYGNPYNIVQGAVFLQKTKHPIGGVVGASIGVSDIEEALKLYQKVLGVGEIMSDETGRWPEFGNEKLRRIVLESTTEGHGAFSPLFGNISIELIQSKDRIPKRIYKDRQWGDLGFIHLCYDIIDMDALQKRAIKHDYRFSVDSKNSFTMETAAGRFCYIEDKDGTLIELVETHKVPLLKKLGWYLDLNKRGKEKPLPKWMLRFLGISKVK